MDGYRGAFGELRRRLTTKDTKSTKNTESQNQMQRNTQDWGTFLREYAAVVRGLPAVFGKGEAYVGALSRERREVFGTLLPLGAAFAKEASRLETFEKAKTFVLSEIERFLGRDAEGGR
jgi:hypothetical protein